jgi:divalent metal cation (Fe/Co/Zn/Cd) transporter
MGEAGRREALAEPGSSRDSVLTVAAATLAGVTLAALFVNSALNWWWADPLAAPVIAAAPVAEATRITVRHQLG